MVKNTISHNSNIRYCTIKLILEQFKNRYPHIYDLIKEFHYKITKKELNYLKKNIPKYDIYVYNFLNMKQMINIIKNMNIILNKELALPTIIDINIILHFLTKIKPGKKGMKIKNMTIKDTYRQTKRYISKIDINKNIWKKMCLIEKFNYIIENDLDKRTARDTKTGKKLTYEEQKYYVNHKDKSMAEQLFWTGPWNIEDIYIINIEYTDEYYVYDIYISPYFGFCYSTFQHSYGYFRLEQNDYHLEYLYSTIIQNFIGEKFYIKYNQRCYYSYGLSYEKKLIRDSVLLNATKICDINYGKDLCWYII